MSEQIEQEKTIHYNDAKIWQIAFFSMNNTAANLYLALMGYISYYANSMAGFSVVLISSLVTAMNIFDGVTDPVVGFLLDKSKGRFGKFRPFMVAGNILMAVSAVLLFATTHLIPNRGRRLLPIIRRNARCPLISIPFSSWRHMAAVPCL